MRDGSNFYREVVLYEPLTDDKKGWTLFSFIHKPIGVNVVDGKLEMRLSSIVGLTPGFSSITFSTVTRMPKEHHGVNLEAFAVKHDCGGEVFEFVQLRGDLWVVAVGPEIELALHQSAYHSLNMLLAEYKELEAMTPGVNVST